MLAARPTSTSKIAAVAITIGLAALDSFDVLSVSGAGHRR
jgi:hypothetical protein